LLSLLGDGKNNELDLKDSEARQACGSRWAQAVRSEVGDDERDKGERRSGYSGVAREVMRLKGGRRLDLNCLLFSWVVMCFNNFFFFLFRFLCGYQKDVASVSNEKTVEEIYDARGS